MTNKSHYDAIPTDLEGSTKQSRPYFRKKLFITLGTIAAAVTGSLVIGGVICAKKEVQEPRRNVIMMVSDGFGPASETFARQYYTWANHKQVKTLLPLDEIHVGHSRTQSSSSLITDSAAGATAFSCALKSFNGAIGVDPHEVPCGTVLESAKIHRNMLTGLVVTSRITHATPASFSAHVAWRDWENDIAEHQIGYTSLGRTVDLMFGGGRCEFMSNITEGSCRRDGRDLLEEGHEKFGWNIMKEGREEFDALDEDNAPLPLMGLFARDHMAYEIDRDDDDEPSLQEMTSKALSILKKKSAEQDTGFFLMIEGSRIDMAAHNNDAAAHVHDILEYQKTVEIVKRFVEDNPNTVVISTSDHETGGLTVGRQVGEDYPEYKWNPEVISRVRNSSELLAEKWIKALKQGKATDDYLGDLIEYGLGVDDVTEIETDRIKAWENSGKNIYDLTALFADIVSARALIGWTTHGHTAVDVNLYAKGPDTEVLRGSHENTEIGDFIVEYLGLDLDDITNRLVKDSHVRAYTPPTNKYHG
ncbi:alkaline-phosphatase-like protein [Pilobolus umbonatus]|nr:alkaline-phosphatase-like protein [Pilobolus umbonatus]